MFFLHSVVAVHIADAYKIHPHEVSDVMGNVSRKTLVSPGHVSSRGSPLVTSVVPQAYNLRPS